VHLKLSESGILLPERSRVVSYVHHRKGRSYESYRESSSESSSNKSSALCVKSELGVSIQGPAKAVAWKSNNFETLFRIHEPHHTPLKSVT